MSPSNRCDTSSPSFNGKLKFKSFHSFGEAPLDPNGESDLELGGKSLGWGAYILSERVPSCNAQEVAYDGLPNVREENRFIAAGPRAHKLPK